MQNYSQSDITNWIDKATPTELVAIAPKLLSKISTLPQNERDQFTREVGNNPQVARLFTGVHA